MVRAACQSLMNLLGLVHEKDKASVPGDVSKGNALPECFHYGGGGEKDLSSWHQCLEKTNFYMYDTCSGPYFLYFNHGILSRMDCIFLNLLQKECEEYTVCLHAHSRLAQGASRIFLEINTRV